MDALEDAKKYVVVTIDDSTKWLDNSGVVTLLALGLVIYAAVFVGKGYPSGLVFFNNPFVKIIAFLTILYLSTRNVGLALIATIAVFAIMIKAQNCPCKENFDTDDYIYPPMPEGCFRTVSYGPEDEEREEKERKEHMVGNMQCAKAVPHQQVVRGRYEIMEDGYIDATTGSQYAPAMSSQ